MEMEYEYEPPNKDARMWAMICHLSALSLWIGIPFGNIVGPAIIFFVKGKDYDFVDDAGREVLNFQISLTIYFIVSVVLCIIVIGVIPLVAIIIGGPIYSIIGGIRANDGEMYRYPLTIRFID